MTAMSREPAGRRPATVTRFRPKAAESISAQVGRIAGRSDAVDMEILPVHWSRKRGCKKEDRLRGFFGGHLRRGTSAGGGPHRGIHRAEADAVHAHAVLFDFDGERFGERD